LLPGFGPACGLGEATIEEVAPDSVPARPTYTAHARPVLTFYCANCHANPGAHAGNSGADGGSGNSRCDDDDDLDYSSYLGSVACFRGVVTTVFEKATMPPGAARRIPPRGQAILRRWREAGFPR